MVFDFWIPFLVEFICFPAGFYLRNQNFLDRLKKEKGRVKESPSLSSFSFFCLAAEKSEEIWDRKFVWREIQRLRKEIFTTPGSCFSLILGREISGRVNIFEFLSSQSVVEFLWLKNCFDFLDISRCRLQKSHAVIVSELMIFCLNFF